MYTCNARITIPILIVLLVTYIVGMSNMLGAVAGLVVAALLGEQRVLDQVNSGVVRTTQTVLA